MDKAVKVESGVAGKSSVAKAIKVKTEAVDVAMIYVQSFLSTYLYQILG